jgi:hypothetical protein
MSSIKIIVVEVGILPETVIRRKVMNLGIKHRRHSGHFAGEGLNSDLKNLKLFVSNVVLSAEMDDVNTWFVDSGASIHMTCNKDWYENFKEISNGGNIYLGDDRAHQIKGYGDIPV